MSTRAERLEGEYLKTLYLLGKTTTDKKMTIGSKSLAAFTRAIVCLLYTSDAADE